MAKKENTGLIHIYTGEGKGKTTAALGQALRAAGRDMKVIMIQFMKGVDTGELEFVKKYPVFKIVQISMGNCFVKSEEQLAEEANKALSVALEEMLSLKYDMVILDEICVSLHLKLLRLEQVLELMHKKPANVELVMTGRNAPQEIIEIADYVTEMMMIKHPFNKGIPARRGIEI
jgi:cob(I)alamin adenosyltransferase